MKTVRILVILALFLGLLQTNAFAQAFKSMDKAKEYFYRLDDKFNSAMATQDTTFLAAHFANSFINCTPVGEINNKKEEIEALVKLSAVKVERIAPQFDIFAYSDNVATLSVIKKVTLKDARILYVRRTIVHEFIKDKWQFVSGQGTNVLPKYIEKN